jgi:LuxR family maltose regulon positive regulatory protein
MLTLLRRAASANGPLGGAERVEAVRGLARALLQRSQVGEGTGKAQQPPSTTLSQRELEVLRLLDSELTGPEIARELYVTLNTLRTHTKRIFAKLDANSRAVAVHRARERGLL